MTSAESQRAAAAWEAAAHEWAELVRGGRDETFDWNAPPFFDLLPPSRGLTVEIGCGEGRVSRELVARGYDVVAFDVSETLISLARDADPRGRYAVADAAQLPLDDAAATLVVAFNVLQEIPHLRETITEIARVLETGGHFCFANVHPVATAGDFESDGDVFVLSSYCATFERARPLGGREIAHFHRPLGEYVAALAGAGFVVEALHELPTRRRARGRIPAFLHLRART